MAHLFLLGAGQVGLVTAVGFVRLGHRVTVADLDGARIGLLQAGVTPVYEPGLTDAISSGIAAGTLVFTTELDPPPNVAISLVCVSTPTGPEGPLMTDNVEAAVVRLVGATGSDHTIVVRSTLPLDGPARLRAVVGARSGAAAITTNPEFLREGSAIADFDTPSRVVVGWLDPSDHAAAKAIAALYSPLLAPTVVADADSVALIKLLSNVFLGMKLSYANEVARIAEATGADVRTVIDGVGLDERIGTSFMQPGPGFGGSCLPEQALAIALETAAINVPTPLLSSIHVSNATHRRAIADRLASLLGGSLAGCRVAMFGLAFKANTDDVRESPALLLASLLREAGCEVVAHDPRAAEKARALDPTLVVAASPLAAATGADAILVVTEWDDYRSVDWVAIKAAMRGSLVYDTRMVVDLAAAMHAGLRVERLGSRSGTAVLTT